jgi:hypothetical protein
VITPLLCGVLLMQAANMRAVEPLYPAQAFQGGTVVAELMISDGRVIRVRTLEGKEPFLQPTLAALREWRFPQDNGKSAELVIVHFRGPNLYTVGSPVQELRLRPASGGLPLPLAIREPAYPPDSMGQGGVILQCSVGRSGKVQEIKVIKGSGDLTGPCSDAVREWRLAPARDAAGNAIPSSFYGICAFRQPVLDVPR